MNAFLVLADGRVFSGTSLGAQGTTIGEVVFSTGMAGFQENLTDPSYYGQILTQTYPLVGNYGMNSQDGESGRVWARGYVVREACGVPSNFRSEMGLDEFLKQNGVVGIQGVDTRRLTRVLRGSGVMNGAITTEYAPGNMDELLGRVRAYAIRGAVPAVSCGVPQVYNEGGAPHVALLDFGCTASLIQYLTKRCCKVTVLPGDTPPEQVRALAPDGILLSNGPGDPAENSGLIRGLRTLLGYGIPTFGVCLGHQLAALAAGARTEKLKYGHRGANQPVTDLETGRTYITSQNHGYTVVGDTLPAGMGRVSYVNANDGSCEGVEYTAWNCFTVQFHPDICGSSKDKELLFDRFIARMGARKGAQQNA